MRPICRAPALRKRRARLAGLRRVAIFALLPALAACHLGDDEEDLPASITGSGLNVTFTAGQSPACPRADLLSIQPSTASGSLIAVDIVLTDCDGSLRASGLGFEVSFDGTQLSFINCSAGTFFPRNQLAPQTPECVVSGGRVLGTLGLTPPNSVVMGGSGQKDVIELSFTVLGKGISTPLTFQSTDLNSGTSLWLIDNTPTVTFHALGGAGYAGGTIVSN